MCYPKPGPRCSGHAKQRRDTAASAYEAARRDPASTETNLAEAASTYARALTEWHSTPDGMKDLEDRIAELSDHATTNPPVVQNIAYLEQVLIQGRETRKRQMAAVAATQNPAAALSNNELKSELTDLIERRMPTLADDPDGLVTEQARFNAVLDEITKRRDQGAWGSRRTTTPAPVPVSVPTVTADKEPVEVSPFGPYDGEKAPPPTEPVMPRSVVAPAPPTQTAQVWTGITQGDHILMPGEGTVRIMSAQKGEERGVRFVDLEMYNPNSGETKTRRYQPEQVVNKVDAPMFAAHGSPHGLRSGW